MGNVKESKLEELSFIKKVIKLWETPIFWSIFINSCFVIICYIFAVPYFETNDDIGMSSIAAGAYGTNREYLIFTNIIYGFVLKCFYNLFPGIAWYTVFQVAILFLSFCTVFYVLNRRLGNRIGVLINIILILIFGTEFFLTLQFTEVSIVASICGFVAVFFGIEIMSSEKSSGILLCIFGGCLILVSSFVRLTGLYSTLIIAFVLGIYSLVCSGLFKRESLKVKILLKYFVVFGAIGSVFLIGQFVNNYAYYGDENWAEFKEFNLLRSELSDYGWPDYDKYVDEYIELGISKNDLAFYKGNNFADRNTLNVEILSRLAELKSGDDKVNFELSSFLNQSLNFLLQKPYFIFFVCVLLLIVILNKEKLPIWFTTVLFLTFLGLMVYYYIRSRMAYRVVTPTIFCLAIGVFSLFNVNSFRFEKVRNIDIFVITALVGILFIPDCIKEYTNFSSKIKDSSVYFEKIEDYNNIYVTPVNSGSNLMYDAWYCLPEDIYLTRISLGGWLSQSPTADYQSEYLNINNIFEPLYTMDNGFLLTSGSYNVVKTYIQEHYFTDNTLGVSVYESIPHNYIYNFTPEILEDKVLRTDFCSKISNVTTNNGMGSFIDIDVSFTGPLDSIQESIDKIYLEVTDSISGVNTYYRAYLDNYYYKEGSGFSTFFVIPRAELENIFINSDAFKMNLVMDLGGEIIEFADITDYSTLNCQ